MVKRHIWTGNGHFFGMAEDGEGWVELVSPKHTLTNKLLMPKWGIASSSLALKRAADALSQSQVEFNAFCRNQKLTIFDDVTVNLK